MSREQRVLVASQNAVKAEAVAEAFEVFGCKNASVELVDFEIQSGVSDQPMSLEETAFGALNRLCAIRRRDGFDWYVAIEGGAYNLDLPTGTVWYESACAAVAPFIRSVRPSIAYGPAYPIPKKLAGHLIEGKDLNQAMEIETGIVEIGKTTGFNGWLTDGKVDRKAGSAQAVLMALYGSLKP